MDPLDELRDLATVQGDVAWAVGEIERLRAELEALRQRIVASNAAFAEIDRLTTELEGVREDVRKAYRALENVAPERRGRWVNDAMDVLRCGARRRGQLMAWSKDNEIMSGIAFDSANQIRVLQERIRELDERVFRLETHTRDLFDAVLSIERELGIHPSGSFDTVANRVAATPSDQTD